MLKKQAEWVALKIADEPKPDKVGTLKTRDT